MDHSPQSNDWSASNRDISDVLGDLVPIDESRSSRPSSPRPTGYSSPFSSRAPAYSSSTFSVVRYGSAIDEEAAQRAEEEEAAQRAAEEAARLRLH